jgi:HD-like signal output (HDOD) protein
MGWFTRRNTGGEGGESSSGAAASKSTEPTANPTPGGNDDGNPEAGAERRVPDALADFFLVMEEHLTEVEREDVVEIVSKLRQPPPILERVTRGLDDPEELTEAVKSNPALSADILRTVNSAAFALLSPISSIQHAITYLGTSLVKGLVLQSTVTRVMEFEHPAQQAAYMRLWRSSYVASTAALLLGQSAGAEQPSVLSTQALLANLGDLALLSARPDLAGIYAPGCTLFSRAKAQQDELIANTAVVSGMLASQWQLPPDITRTLRHAYVPMAVPPADHPDAGDDLLSAVICYLAARLGDQVAFHELRDVDDFDAGAQDALEYFYLPDYLSACGHPGLPAHFHESGVRRRLNHLITNLGQE